MQLLRNAGIISQNHPHWGSSTTENPGKTSCPKNLQQDQSLVQRWLQEAIHRGNFGKFDQGLPRVVWHEQGIPVEIRVNTMGIHLPHMTQL